MKKYQYNNNIIEISHVKQRLDIDFLSVSMYTIVKGEKKLDGFAMKGFLMYMYAYRPPDSKEKYYQLPADYKCGVCEQFQKFFKVKCDINIFFMDKIATEYIRKFGM